MINKTLIASLLQEELKILQESLIQKEKVNNKKANKSKPKLNNIIKTF